MKIIGLIGGLSWVSSIEYYRHLNEEVNRRLGGVSAAQVILYSVNFAEIKALTEAGRWDEIEKKMSGIAQQLEAAGADCLLIGANTMHRIAPQIQQSIKIPVIHIADVVAEEIRKNDFHTVALLGTKYTMQLDFYKDRLALRGIQTIIPGDDDIAFINSAIYEEMGAGLFLPATKKRFLSIINSLAAQGAEGIVLGCTEIPILIRQTECPTLLFDTTLLHAKAAVDFALG